MHLELKVCLSAQHGAWMFVIVSILLHTSCVIFSFLKTLFLASRQLLDTSSTTSRQKLDTYLFYRDFQVCSRHLLTDSSIYLANFLELLSAQQLLDTSSIYRDLFAIDTSSIPLHLSRINCQYLLNTSSIYRATFFYIQLRFDLILFILKHLDTSLFSLNPNTHFSTISLFPSRFRPYPSFNFFVSVLSPLFFTFFMHFMHLDLGFLVLGKFWGFCVFAKILGMGLV